jgi:predicted transcriptional regulator
MDVLEAEMVAGGGLEKVVHRACACDLLSEVLRCMSKDSILLTNLTHIQTVHVADMVDAVAICYTRSKKPKDDTVNLAREKGIVLLSTQFSTYEASGRLYQSGLPGCAEK